VLQRIRTERRRDRDIGRIATARDQHAAYPRNVVARIECVPAPVQVRLEPRSEVHRAVRRRDPNVAKIAGAVSRRNVHAAAKRDREVRIVAAHTGLVMQRLPRGPREARVLIPERDVPMHVIADRLHARPPRRRRAEQLPRDV